MYKQQSGYFERITGGSMPPYYHLTLQIIISAVLLFINYYQTK